MPYDAQEFASRVLGRRVVWLGKGVWVARVQDVSVDGAFLELTLVPEAHPGLPADHEPFQAGAQDAVDNGRWWSGAYMGGAVLHHPGEVAEFLAEAATWPPCGGGERYRRACWFLQWRHAYPTWESFPLR